MDIEVDMDYLFEYWMDGARIDILDTYSVGIMVGYNLEMNFIFVHGYTNGWSWWYKYHSFEM